MVLLGVCVELFLKIVQTFSFSVRRRRLNRVFRSKGLGTYWPPVPLPSLNTNQLPSPNIDEYIREYLSLNLRIFPFLVETASLGPKSLTLDFGCGFGTLASAFASGSSQFGDYIGIDSNCKAIAFCKDAYSGHKEFRFGCLERSASTNYVTNWGIRSAKQNFLKRKMTAPSKEELGQLVGARQLDCQFSLSVFTHMWPDDSTEALRVFTSFSNQATRFVNSWLILDTFAAERVREGKADRVLPISVGGIQTYSQLNPLLCTAYPIGLLEEVYSNAGHRILDILYGSWAGRDNGVTYQDLVISEKVYEPNPNSGWSRHRPSL